MGYVVKAASVVVVAAAVCANYVGVCQDYCCTADRVHTPSYHDEASEEKAS